MYTTSFHYTDGELDVEVTIRRATVRDRVTAQMVYAGLGLTKDSSPADWNMAIFFANFLTQSAIKGTLGFELPAPTADRATLQAALDNVADLPAEFWDMFTRKSGEVDRPEEKKA